MEIIEHTIRFKWPKMFGKKKVDETEVKTEINLENKDKYILIGGALVVGMTLGYLIGHHKGASRTPQNILILK